MRHGTANVIGSHLSAIDAELATRTRPDTGPDIEEAHDLGLIIRLI
jgi:hypothetical protein